MCSRNGQTTTWTIYKTTNNLKVKNLEVYLELFKDEEGNYIKYKVIDKAESLEQLRALQNGMKIKVGIVENIPVGIDTMEDFEKFKAMVEG